MSDTRPTKRPRIDGVLSDLSDEDVPRQEEVSRRTSGMSDKDLRRVIVDIVRNNDEAWRQFLNIVPLPPGQSVIDATPAPKIIPVSSAVVEQDDDEPESDFDYTEFENECDAVMIAMEKYGTMKRYSNNALETVEAIVTEAYEAIANDCLEDDAETRMARKSNTKPRRMAYTRSP